jgi:hypothetical protein
MINGCHVLLYSRNPEADRAFVRDVLRFKTIDIGHGWLIFGLPPSEMAVHPDDGGFTQTHANHTMMGAVVYLMCDDLAAEIQSLKQRGVTCTEVETAPWGEKTTIPLPSGGEIGLYQPRHPTAIG